MNSRNLPAWVVDAKPSFIEDADGDSALSVLIVISSESPEIVKNAHELLAIKKLVRSALKQSGVEVFPYFRFVSQADL